MSQDGPFPETAALILTIRQDTSGYYEHRDWRRVERFSSAACVPRHLRCLNPLCQQGGLDLHAILMSWQTGEHDFSCHGHEGSPTGRRKGDPCCNRFLVSLVIERRRDDQTGRAPEASSQTLTL
jgi:hypothetical protein